MNLFSILNAKDKSRAQPAEVASASKMSEYHEALSLIKHSYFYDMNDYNTRWEVGKLTVQRIMSAALYTCGMRLRKQCDS